jgi:hypothetical protein
MNEPTDGLAQYQSIKTVLAGRITEVVPAGCYVQEANGIASVFRVFEEGMTVRYQPQVGDYWVVYQPDGYQSISPKAVFEAGYVLMHKEA